MDSYFLIWNISFVENYHLSIFTTFAKQSMINRLSNPINRNRSAAKNLKVMSSSVSVKQDKQVEKEELRAEDKHKPSEAWVPMNTEPVQTDIMKNILTIGGSILRFLLKLFNHPYIAERKAMPLAVVAAFVIYFCTAMGFYLG